MFRSQKSYDRVNVRNVELARQVKDLNEENRHLYKENKDLRYENEELNDIIKKILTLSICNTYSNDRAVLGKIKELVEDYQSNN